MSEGLQTAVASTTPALSDAADGVAVVAMSVDMDVDVDGSGDDGANAEGVPLPLAPATEATPRSVSSSPEEGDEKNEESGTVVGNEAVDVGVGPVVAGDGDGGEGKADDVVDSPLNDVGANANDDDDFGGKEKTEPRPQGGGAGGEVVKEIEATTTAVTATAGTGSGSGIQMKLSLGNKKRKRRPRQQAGGAGMSKFTDEDEVDESKRRMPALDLGGLTGSIDMEVEAETKDSVATDSDSGGRKNSTEKEDENSKEKGSEMDENNQDGEQEQLGPSIHSHAVPPERVMSPMPQREDSSRPLCPSPNVGAVAVEERSLSLLSQQQQSQQQQIQQQQQFSQQQIQQQQLQQKQQQLQQRVLQQKQQQQHQQQYAQQQLQQRFQTSTTNSNNRATNQSSRRKNASDPSKNTNTSLVNNTSNIQSSIQSPNKKTSEHQPPGWRVKLYRLNADGTWDDCGTGRIQFYRARQQQQQPQKQQPQHEESPSKADDEGKSDEKIQSSSSGDGDGEEGQRDVKNATKNETTLSPQKNPSPPVTTTMAKTATTSVFSELGEPMLCMRAEVPQQQQQQQRQNKNGPNDSGDFNDNDNDAAGGGSDSNSVNQKVLLRTRVLLHNAYQCQGGNIITWCEPFNVGGGQGNSNTSNSNQGEGRQQQQQGQGQSQQLSQQKSNDEKGSEPQSSSGGSGSGSGSGSVSVSGPSPQQQPQQQAQQQLNNNLVSSASTATAAPMSTTASTTTSTSPVPAGVDLALSFQDNSGCKDIWQRITEVQARAKELSSSQSWGNSNRSPSASFGNDQHHDGTGIGIDGGNKGGLGGIRNPNTNKGGNNKNLVHQHQHQHHGRLSPNQHTSPPSQHHHQQHSSPPQKHAHPGHLLHAPNSPDHDALEDRQLSMVSAMPLGIPPRPPLIAAKDASSGGSGSGSTSPGPNGMDQHRLHVHNHATTSPSKVVSSLDQAEERTHANNEAAGDSSISDGMDAVSMAAAAAASYGIVNAATGSSLPERGADDDSFNMNNNNSSNENENEVTNPSPLPMLSNNSNAGNRDGTPLQQPQQQQQQHGFSPLQFNTISPNNNINNNNLNNANTLSSMIVQQLPSKPTWNDLPTISDFIASWSQQFPQQREELLMFLARDDCEYVRKLLGLLSSPAVYNSGGGGKYNCDGKTSNIHVNNPENLSEEDLRSELALTIKSILLLNDPEIIEYVTSSPQTFVDICAIFEYDPELRHKADHMAFLSQRAKFRTVTKMEDEELVNNIHRLFRVSYLRDVLLRPTMDEGSLSTLVSLGQFTMSDIVKGVVLSNGGNVSGNDNGVGNQHQQGGNSSNNEDASAVPLGEGGCGQNGENYLIRIIRMLGTEIQAIQKMKWDEKERGGQGVTADTDLPTSTTQQNQFQPCPPQSPSPTAGPPTPPQSPIPTSSVASQSITWEQHLVPQDPSLPSRLARRKGCLSFLNELFNMARMSLQQHEKDDFVETTVTMMVPLNDTLDGDDDANNVKNNDEGGARQQCNNVNLLSLLSSLLSDPTATDPKERGCALDIIGMIAMHDPSLIRKYCLDYVAYETELKKAAASGASSITNSINKNDIRPDPNDAKEVLFSSPPNDLLLSLIFVMGTETDAGLLLQTSEIIRIILDTEMMGEQQQEGQSSPGGSFLEEENDFNAANTNNGNGGNEGNSNMQMAGDSNDSNNGNSSSGGLGMASLATGVVESEQNSFLALFYNRYVQWLVVPFQYKIFVPTLTPPTSLVDDGKSSNAMCRIQQEFKHRSDESEIGQCSSSSSPFRQIESCNVRSSFILEILSFCIRAHVHRMKFFMLRTRMLGIILKILGRRVVGTSLLLSPPQLSGGVRCLKLASLKLLRSVLSVKDEFYHRHIVQYNLFSPVFDLFREGGTFIGNNLISSAILEMCDFICLENIKSLIDHIVTKHLSMAMNTSTANDTNTHSLEDIANPHVDTFKQMRKAYEDNTKTEEGGGGAGLLHCSGDADLKGSFHDGMQLMMNGRGRSILNKKGLEDQRKFREADEEESYFNEDDDVVATTEVAIGTTNAAEATAVMCTNTAAAAGAPPEGKVSTTEDVASLMEDVKSLDQ